MIQGQALLAAVLTALGGVVLAITNYFLNRGKSQLDFAAQIREELRKDNATLRDELRTVQKELSDFKGKCYSLLESQGKLEIANSELKAEVVRLKQILKDNNIVGY